MTQFFDKSQMLDVSQITNDGWWVKNTTEHVAKGTALGDEYTQNIYTPSQSGMIARYDREADVWCDEITDMTWKSYWDKNGQHFVISSPDGEYPEWAIQEEPPEHNLETQTVLYTEQAGWTIYDAAELGRLYYDEWGNESIVSDYHFALPANHTWERPPEALKNHVVKRINGQWQQLVDHRGKTAYSKQRNGEDYQVEDLGEIPDTHTLKAPNTQFDQWADGKWVTDAKAYCQYELARLINSIDTTAAAIITKWTRFSEEYAEREKAAQAFKATDYKGEPNLYITSFSTAAGITDQQAAELILSQAENLRTVQATLGALRMRKYELKQPNLSVDELQAIHDDIITKMQEIGKSYD